MAKIKFEIEMDLQPIAEIEGEDDVRQSIVNNLSALVSRRNSIKKNDPITEAIKDVARGIATRKY